MIENLWNGICAALAFIGFVSVIYLILIHIFSLDEGYFRVYYIDESFTAKDLIGLIYRRNIIDTMLWNSFCEIIIVYDTKCEENWRERFNSLSDDLENLVLLESKQLADYIKRKGKHGTGIY